ncbi:MAG TPA: type II toxin-antitoxin system RelE/ParE family toxin [Mucilaginibacter sp.]|nr:type II toxin-antitoxin system RelE/ParE family toxin [Mucilaginibacter sp.]
MPRQIKWSTRAILEWVEILEYWTDRDKSNLYSLKLDQLFKETFDLVTELPELGIPANYPLVRIKIVRDYMIYYRTQSESIEILAIWDTRRNPKKFKL